MKKFSRLTSCSLFVLSWAIVAFGQPAYGSLPSLLCSLLGFAPLFSVVADLPLKRRVALGILWFAGVQGVQLYWFTSLEAFGDPMMKIGGWAAYLFLVCLWSIQFGLFAIFITRERLLQIRGALLMASIWSLLEISRLYVLSGFSWNPVGLALTGNLVTAQVVSVGGIYLLSFWIVFQSCILYRAVECDQTGRALRGSIPYLLTAAIPWIGGAVLLGLGQRGAQLDQSLRFAIYQTQSPPEAAFLAGNRNPVEATFLRWMEVIDEVKLLKEEVEKGGGQIDLLLFPEYFVSFAMERPIYPFEWIDQALGSLGSVGSSVGSMGGERTEYVSNQWIGQWIANYLDADVVIGMEITGARGQENGAALFVPQGKEVATYSKRILVPMGEAIPAEWLKPLAAKFGVTDSFIAGTKAGVLHGKNGAVGVSICYEETFGHLMCENRALGANLLVNLSNDIWYPNSLLAKQHFDHGRLRAIELGLPLLRACNGGISSAINPDGREVELSPVGKHMLIGQMILKKNNTLYIMWENNLIIMINLIILLLLVIF